MKKTEEIENNESSFTFGEPQAIHNENVWDYMGTFLHDGGEYYVPPISLVGLAKMNRANGHHGSCIIFRRGMLSNAYTSGGLSPNDFKKCVTDYLTFGNAYIELVRNSFGKIVELQHIPAINMRVLTNGKGYRLLYKDSDYVDFAKNEIIHVKEYDTMQQIYGQCDWIGGLQSALLNQEATLFRRRYYVNGAHLGYILYCNDAKLKKTTIDKISKSFTEGKGLGNFRSAFFHIPKGEENAFQIIPIGDIAKKDEFVNIKNISASDVREAHRVPPVLMGIVPQGTSSLGDPLKIEEVYMRTEVKSMAQAFISINENLPSYLKFKFNFNIPTPQVENNK